MLDGKMYNLNGVIFTSKMKIKKLKHRLKKAVKYFPDFFSEKELKSIVLLCNIFINN